MRSLAGVLALPPRPAWPPARRCAGPSTWRRAENPTARIVTKVHRSNPFERVASQPAVKRICLMLNGAPVRAPGVAATLRTLKINYLATTGGCYTLGEGPSRTDRNRAQTRVDPPLKTDENLRRGGGF